MGFLAEAVATVTWIKWMMSLDIGVFGDNVQRTGCSNKKGDQKFQTSALLFVRTNSRFMAAWNQPEGPRLPVSVHSCWMILTLLSQEFQFFLVWGSSNSCC